MVYALQFIHQLLLPHKGATIGPGVFRAMRLKYLFLFFHCVLEGSGGRGVRVQIIDDGEYYNQPPLDHPFSFSLLGVKLFCTSNMTPDNDPDGLGLLPLPSREAIMFLRSFSFLLFFLDNVSTFSATFMWMNQCPALQFPIADCSKRGKHFFCHKYLISYCSVFNDSVQANPSSAGRTTNSSIIMVHYEI